MGEDQDHAIIVENGRETHENDKQMQKRFGFDLVLVKRLWHFLKIAFPHWYSNASLLVGFVLLVSVIEQVLAYFIGIIPSEFYVVLGNRDLRGFHFLAGKALCLIIAKAFSGSSLKYSTYALYLNLRQTICYKLHFLYFKKLAFYRLNVLSDCIDNPDQRITQDVEKTTRLLATEILAPLLLAPFIIAYYTYLTYNSSGYLGPLAIFGYFVLATVINKWLLGPIVNLVVQQEKREGDFRFKHVSVRSNAEAIGFYHSGELEKSLTNHQLENLLHTQYRLIKRQFFLNFSTTISDYFGAVLSYFIIAIPVFVLKSYEHTDPVELTGIVSRNSFYYMYLIHQFTTIIDLSTKLGNMAGTAHRVVELVEELERIQETPTALSMNAALSGRSHQRNKKTSLTPSTASNTASTLLANPDSANTVEDLSLEIRQGSQILITGDSSAGKTSLLRVLAGLWHVSRGIFEGPPRYSPSEVLFLPQKPYCPDGHTTLRQQLLYPISSSKMFADIDDKQEELRGVLRLVHLEGLIQKCNGFDSNVEWDWLETLSPGELQRLSLARAFLHRPKILFLDEATSALGFDMESQLYADLQTVVSRNRKIKMLFDEDEDSIVNMNDNEKFIHLAKVVEEFFNKLIITMELDTRKIIVACKELGARHVHYANFAKPCRFKSCPDSSRPKLKSGQFAMDQRQTTFIHCGH